MVAAFMLFSTGIAMASSSPRKTTAKMTHKPKTEKKVTNSFATPDFAYPETVINNAEVKLSASATDVEAVQAVLQLTIARSIKSRDAASGITAMIDSVAEARGGATAAVLYSIEAAFVAGYMESEWDSDNRELPLDTPFPADMQLWSGDMFRLRVLDLCKKAMADPAMLKGTPMSQWSGLLTEFSSDQQALCPDLYTFLAMRSVDQLRSVADGSKEAIPFFGSDSPYLSPGQRCAAYASELLVSLTGHAEELSSAPMLGILLPRLDYDTTYERFKRMKEAYERFRDREDAGTLLLKTAEVAFFDLRSDIEDDKKTYCEEKHNILAEIDSYVDRFPNSSLTRNLRNYRTRFLAENIHLDGRDIYRTDSLPTMTLTGLKEGKTMYLKLFRFKGNPSGSKRLMERILSAAYSEHVQTLEVKGSSSPCDNDTVTVSFDKLPYGSYGIVLASIGGANRSGIIGDYNVYTFDVSDLTSMPVNDTRKPLNCGVYAIDNSNGAPMAGATVDYTYDYQSNDRSAKSSHHKVSTDSDGFAPVPSTGSGRYFNYEISKGKDKCSGSIYLSNYNSERRDASANIYTDLALYHPGDTVRFAVVAYRSDADGSEIVKDLPMEARLYDASGVKVDSVTLTTDSYGRAESSFRLPTEGMNGNFRIQTVRSDSDKTLGSAWVDVADYTTPKFFVEVAASAKSYKPDDTVRLEGKALTYSGMAVADAKVKLNVDFTPMWFWRYRDGKEASFSTDLETDAEGKFSIELPTSNLSAQYTRGLFRVSAAVTSQAGETRQSAPAFFSLGASSSVSITSAQLIEAEGKTIALRAEVQDLDGSPVKAEVEYSLVDLRTGRTVSEGRFTSPTLSLNSADIPSGYYRFSVRIPSSEEPQTKDITIYRKTDKVPARESALWIPDRQFQAPAGTAAVPVTVGSSFPDSHILCVISDKNGIIEKRWLKADAANLKVKLPVPDVNNCIYANFATVHDGKYYSANVKVEAEEQTQKLEAEVVTFRDKIEAGGKETWRFRYKLGDSLTGVIPVMATMTDKALNAITPFFWNSIPLYDYWSTARLTGYSTGTDSESWHISGKMLKNAELPGFPTLYTYGYPLYGTLFMNDYVMCYGATAPRMMANATSGVKIRGTRSIPEAKMAMKSEMTDEAVEEEAAADMADAGSGSEDRQEEETYRASECPVAFFMPSLLTDRDGVLELAFTAPDFNTTWQLQMLAYTPQARSNVTTLQTVAAKKVMVSAQLPKFLRTGDRAVLAFTAFNNSGDRASIALRAEVADPLSGKVLTSADFSPRATADGESFVQTLEFTAPDDLTAVTVRVTAAIPGYSDGEQSMIGIVPSSTPVTESYPFYMAPGETESSVSYPGGSEGSSAMFSYCDNPVWQCVTALPDIMEVSDASILSTLIRLYGNAYASSLTTNYPQIREAIRLWSETADSTLVSPLQRDGAMKIVELGQTPWTLDAEGETLRMSRLSRLLDGEACHKSIDAAIAEILRRQLPSGAWSWCEGMQPSTYITGRVLLYFSMMSHLFAFSTDMNDMLQKAMTYMDAKLYKDYIRAGKNFSTVTMMNYLYVRSGLIKTPMSKEFEKLSALALQAVRKEWKNMDIYDTAVAAILLNRKGYPMEARSILESLSQKATTDAKRGMWFDNLDSSWRGRNKLITTMQVLEAFAEVSPKAPQIDMLRQWLLLQRQTEDWGDAPQIAEVVYAILTSGSDWTDNSAPATFTLDGKPLEVSRRDALTGSFNVPVPAQGATIKVMKSEGHPAWGGVLTRSIRPITQVKEFSQSDIAVAKRLLLVREDSTGTHTVPVTEGQRLRKGERVRVELTLRLRRDMDYVSVLDGRSACLQPVQQLSGYVWQDGAGYYRDVRLRDTNLFFDFLKKGTTIVTYDCFVSQDGDYTLGIASAQCLYAPLQSAHSAGDSIEVRE